MYTKKNFFIFFLLVLFSCEYLERKADLESTEKIDKSLLNFNDSVCYQYIEKQVSFGPRSPSSSGHSQCADWILSELKILTDTSYFQNFEAITYDSKKHNGKNIIAKINPSNPNRILLCAHWDTRPIADQDTKDQTKPILGANDAGSGVGVILAALHSLKTNPSKLGIDIVFFDIEDYGQPVNSGLPPMENDWCLGSQFWGKNYSETYRPKWGILLDMVGGKNATFLKEEVSAVYAANLQNRLWGNGEKLGFGAYFKPIKMGQIQDDHLFVNTLTGIPTVDIIDYKENNGGFADYWHTHADNMSSVDRNTLKAVGTLLMYTIREEDQIGQ